MLATNPGSLNLRDLDKFSEHDEWFHKKRPGKEKVDEPEDIADTQTPEERILSLTRALNSQLADEILAVVRAMDPFKFEQLVVDLLFAMGYGD